MRLYKLDPRTELIARPTDDLAMYLNLDQLTRMEDGGNLLRVYFGERVETLNSSGRKRLLAFLNLLEG